VTRTFKTKFRNESVWAYSLIYILLLLFFLYYIFLYYIISILINYSTFCDIAYVRKEQWYEFIREQCINNIASVIKTLQYLALFIHSSHTLFYYILMNEILRIIG
jgi:hypothetical protein